MNSKQLNSLVDKKVKVQLIDGSFFSGILGKKDSDFSLKLISYNGRTVNGNIVLNFDKIEKVQEISV